MSDAHYSIQTGEAICYIHLEPVYPMGDRYNVQLFHQQLVKGIPSFRLQDMDSVMKFINGFLFNGLREDDYQFYCEAMVSVFFGNDLLLSLFNVRRKHSKTLLVEQKSPLDTGRRLR